MNKKLAIILTVCFCLCFSMVLCGCNAKVDKEVKINEKTTVVEDDTKIDEDTKVEEEVVEMPSAQEVVNARKLAVDDTQQGYDFKVNLEGTVNLYGYEGKANANYDGSYRYDSKTNELNFKRETSGLLLYDSIEYIYNTESSKIKLVANEDGVVKKSSVVPKEEETLNLVNIPFVALIDSLKDINIKNIENSKTGYKYCSKIAVAANNEKINALIGLLGKLGTNIEMGEVSFSNVANGLDFYFNLDKNNKLNDFKFSADITFPVKGVGVTFKLTYSQKASTSEIDIPSVEGFITDSTKIKTEVNTINNAFNTLKNSATYSIDLDAKNEFDPGWNKKAIVDKYIARLYKNTNEGRIDFNNSFEYKAHSEEDGAETYKYTLANIQDGSIYQVARKRKNIVTEVNGKSVDKEFEYLVGAAMVNAADIDCITKSSKDGVDYFNMYLKNDKTISIQKRIINMINSNNAEGVVDVENYFNDMNKIKESEVVIAMKDGNIVSIDIKTELKYNPTAGDYKDSKITLTNSINLVVNESLSNAQNYKAPEKTNTTITKLGLNNSKFYIK